MSEFFSPADIGNRALQHCGAKMMSATAGFTENSVNARQVSFVYGKLRRAELRRNVWRFATRRAVLRAIDTTTMQIAASLWMPSVTYFVGSIVADQFTNLWISNTPDNLGNDPLASTTWEPYFGPLTVQPWTSTLGYYSGELVYTDIGDGTNRVYLSLISNNTVAPATATAWVSTSTYKRDDVVTFNSVAYLSTADLNLGNEPDLVPAVWTTSFVGGAGSLNWRQIGGAEFPNGVTLAQFNVIYPLGSGPSSQFETRNIFRLPAGFMREAPQDPKAGAVPYLGASTSLSYKDWEYEGDFLVSRETGPIVYRFVADVTDVTRFDDMFCEALGCRIALAVCEPLTQSISKLGMIAKEYEKFASEARTVNGIETGSVEPPEDEFLAVRY